MVLPIGERVHVTGNSLGFLKICWYLYGYITINNSVEHEQAGITYIHRQDDIAQQLCHLVVVVLDPTISAVLCP